MFFFCQFIPSHVILPFWYVYIKIRNRSWRIITKETLTLRKSETKRTYFYIFFLFLVWFTNIYSFIHNTVYHVSGFFFFIIFFLFLFICWRYNHSRWFSGYEKMTTGIVRILDIGFNVLYVSFSLLLLSLSFGNGCYGIIKYGCV